MNPRTRRTRTRTERDNVVLRRKPIDPRLVCVKCYEPCGKAVYCDAHRPKREE